VDVGGTVVSPGSDVLVRGGWSTPTGCSNPPKTATKSAMYPMQTLPRLTAAIRTKRLGRPELAMNIG
jgi:hypothetical protein